MKFFTISDAVSTHAWNAKIRPFDIEAENFDAALKKAGKTLATGVIFQLDGRGPYKVMGGRAWIQAS